MKIKAFLRTALWNIVCWTLVVVGLILVPVIYLMGVMKLRTAQARFVNALVTFWSSTMVKMSGSSLKIEGIENIPKDHSYCIVANHQGYFDILVILLTIPWTVGFVAKKELSKVPFLSIWMKAIGVIFLDRSNAREAIGVMKRASERVKAGYPMVIFPEGTRSLGGPVATFKQGSLKLATLAKTRILPVTIDGTYKIIEGEEKGINPAKLTVLFHPIVDVATLPEEDIPNLASKLRETIAAPLELKQA
jgi:1-acyl-sn-glycerol-3-phosphate acyltransferase